MKSSPFKGVMFTS